MNGLFLVVIAAVLLGVAGILALIEPTEVKYYFALMAFGCGTGFLGVKLP